jgi:DNA replication protein DnaD
MNKEFLLVTTQSKDDQQVLSMLLRDGALRMSDGERLSLMEMIASNSDQNLEAVRKKIKIQTAMAANRAQFKKDRNAIRRLYGL